MKTIYGVFRVVPNYGDGFALYPYIIEVFNEFARFFKARFFKWRRSERYQLDDSKDARELCILCDRTKKKRIQFIEPLRKVLYL